jgi:ABC-type transporter Mla subunit MlaD
MDNVAIAAIIVAAVAIVLQAVFLFSLSRSAKAMAAQVNEFVEKAEPVLADARQTLAQSRKQMAEVTGKANQVLDSAQAQISKIDGLLSDATSRAKVQMDRLEMVLDDSIDRVHETVAVLHNGILRPLREVNGIVAGLRAGIGYLLGNRRPSVAQATHDDEMFI